MCMGTKEDHSILAKCVRRKIVTCAKEDSSECDIQIF